MRTLTDISKLVDNELRGGDPRSAEYRLGMLDLLSARLYSQPLPRRYQAGTVQFDAYYAGVERGLAAYHTL